MSCPAPERLARLDDDEAVARHAAECARCRALLDEQMATRALLDGLAPVRLAPARQAAMAAELLARADRATPRRKGMKRFAGVAAAVAIAAGVAIAIGVARAPGRSVPGSVSGSGSVPESVSGSVPESGSGSVPESVSGSVPESVSGSGVARVPAKLVAARGAQYHRDAIADRDVVTLTAGTITLDGGAQMRPVDVRVGAAAVAVAGGHVEIATRGGAIATVTVFAGLAEVALGAQRIVVDAGVTWRNPDAAPVAVRDKGDARDRVAPIDSAHDDTAPQGAAPADAAEVALAEFRAGWRALRKGHDADAVAAFDRATDPVIAEDASYWAAVATERLGDPDGAERRFRVFLGRFPESPRAGAARDAIVRLYSIQSRP